MVREHVICPLHGLVLFVRVAYVEVEQCAEVRHELVPPPEYDLGVVEAALDGNDVIGLHTLLLFQHFFHLVEVAILHHVHFELCLELEGVVRVRLVEFGLIVVDLLVCLVEEVVEFLKEG